MALNDVLNEVAKQLGLMDTRIDTLRRKQAELSESIRDNHDRLEALKKRVDDLDSRLIKKKHEYDAAGPGRKRIIKEEIKLLFAQQDRITEPVSAIADRIRLDELVKDKIDILIFAEENPSRTEEIDEMTLDMKEWLDEQKVQSMASAELGDASYSHQEDEAELDSRLNAIDGVDEAAKTSHSDPIDERIAQLG